MKIAFLCSQQFALPVLQALAGKSAVAAIGLPDIKPDVVALFRQQANQLGLPVTIFSKQNLKEQMNNWLRDLQPEAVFVYSFPFRIPATLLRLPPSGFINFHGGLLPEMRGADPIFESIRRQKKVAGVTAHLMDAQFDTGPVIVRREVPLPPHFTYGMLSGQLAYLAAEMCVQLFGQLADNSLPEPTKQNESTATYYPRIDDQALRLNWNEENSTTLLALVNSCNPILPTGIPTVINGWMIGVCDATIVNITGDTSTYKPGTIVAADQQNGLLVLTCDRASLRLDVVYTREGYFPGYKLGGLGIAPGMVFSSQ